MKAARLGRTPAHDKGASHAIQFPRAIRKTHLRCFPLLRSSCANCYLNVAVQSPDRYLPGIHGLHLAILPADLQSAISPDALRDTGKLCLPANDPYLLAPVDQQLIVRIL